MKWRGFGAESPSGLHCTNQYWSTDRPMGRSSNCWCIGYAASTDPDWIQISQSGSHQWVRIAVTRNLTDELTRTYIRTYTHTTYKYNEEQSG